MFAICLFVCSFVRYQTCERRILKTNERILMPDGTSGSRVKDMKQSTLGIRRSKNKVTRQCNRSHKSLSRPVGQVLTKHRHILR